MPPDTRYARSGDLSIAYQVLGGDKGYSSPTARGRLRRRGIVPVVPTKSNEPQQPSFDREAF